MRYFYENKVDKLYIRCGTKTGFRAHFHKHLEMIYYVKGEANIIVDGKRQNLQDGDLFIAFPNQVHEIEYIVKKKNYLIIFDPDFCKEYKEIFTGNVPEANVIKQDKRIGMLIEGLYKAYTDLSDDDIKQAVCRGYLLIIIGLILKQLKLEKRNSMELDAVHNVLLYCMNNYKRKITLDDIATALHLNKYYISRVFSKNISMSMTDYVNSLRISYAEELLLETDQDITYIAYECGFENIRSFNRAFCRINGISPSRWRIAKKQEI